MPMPKRISRKGFLAVAILERMARVLLTKPPRNVHGFKCWPGDARCIEHGSFVVFLGVNPSGGLETLAHERDQGYLSAPMSGGRTGTRTLLIKSGSKWEGALRATACFNVCSYRTARAGDLSPEL